jgi:hypothetical protein
MLFLFFSSFHDLLFVCFHSSQNLFLICCSYFSRLFMIFFSYFSTLLKICSEQFLRPFSNSGIFLEKVIKSTNVLKLFKKLFLFSFFIMYKLTLFSQKNKSHLICMVYFGFFIFFNVALVLTPSLLQQLLPYVSNFTSHELVETLGPHVLIFDVS